MGYSQETKPEILKNYHASYADGSEIDLMAHNLRDALLHSAELSNAELVAVTIDGEW